MSSITDKSVFHQQPEGSDHVGLSSEPPASQTKVEGHQARLLSHHVPSRLPSFVFVISFPVAVRASAGASMYIYTRRDCRRRGRCVDGMVDGKNDGSSVGKVVGGDEGLAVGGAEG